MTTQVEELRDQAKKFIEAAEAFIADPENASLDDAYCDVFRDTTTIFAAAWFEDESGYDVMMKLFGGLQK